MKEDKIYDMVIMLGDKNVEVFFRNVKYLRENLKAEKIFVVCSRKVKEKIRCLNVDVIEEDELYPNLSILKIKKMLKEKVGDDRRAGWYFQQFLKMAYSYRARYEYYLIWDADTIPLKPIRFFDGDYMMLNMKNERNSDYFSTIINLLGNEIDIIDDNEENPSFISEGMIIKTDIMKELIAKICQQDIPGLEFWEKIINAIKLECIAKSGFSEFETYGTYLNTYYKNQAKKMYLNTERRGYILFNDIPKDNVLKNLPYDTISFEHWDKNKNVITKLYDLLKIKMKRGLNNYFGCRYREL